MDPCTITRLDDTLPDPGLRLSAAEQAALATYEAPKRRSDWTLGRAAAKQAVRELLVRGGLEAPAWGAFSIRSCPHTGAPRVTFADGRQAPAVSLTHGHGQAAAWASPPGPGGGLPGVDLELVRPRRLGTLRFYLHPAEREWVLALPGAAVDPPPKDAAPTPRDLAAIVLWALKEASFKALQPPRGTGLLDVALTLDDPYDALKGRAQVTYRGRAEARAAQLGMTRVEAGWTRSGDLVLAWAAALDAKLPDTT